MSVEVFFFGGQDASESDMKVWVASAKAQQAKIDFTAFHWSEKDKEKKAVAAIKASKADKIFIVGHSSGCKNANSVDNNLAKDKTFEGISKVVLVALDGFVPDSDQLARKSTQVWSALGPGGEPSLNYKKVKGAVGISRLTLNFPPTCTKVWPLHFSLVNAKASDSVVKGIATGYAQCQAFLTWLSPPPSSSTPPASASPPARR